MNINCSKVVPEHCVANRPPRHSCSMRKHPFDRRLFHGCVIRWRRRRCLASTDILWLLTSIIHFLHEFLQFNFVRESIRGKKWVSLKSVGESAWSPQLSPLGICEMKSTCDSIVILFTDRNEAFPFSFDILHEPIVFALLGWLELSILIFTYSIRCFKLMPIEHSHTHVLMRAVDRVTKKGIKRLFLVSIESLSTRLLLLRMCHTDIIIDGTMNPILFARIQNVSFSENNSMPMRRKIQFCLSDVPPSNRNRESQLTNISERISLSYTHTQTHSRTLVQFSTRNRRWSRNRVERRNPRNKSILFKWRDVTFVPSDDQIDQNSQLFRICLGRCVTTNSTQINKFIFMWNRRKKSSSNGIAIHLKFESPRIRMCESADGKLGDQKCDQIASNDTIYTWYRCSRAHFVTSKVKLAIQSNRINKVGSPRPLTKCKCIWSLTITTIAIIPDRQPTANQSSSALFLSQNQNPHFIRIELHKI